MAKENEFLGRGWSFPPSFDISAKGVEMVEGKEDIEQSLKILLSTTIGERIMQPKYGCNLQDYQFDPINSSFVGLLKDTVSDAILYFEPRIKVDNISVSADNSLSALEGKVIIKITYYIRSTNSRFNFVYDFYRTEGFNSL